MAISCINHLTEFALKNKNMSGNHNVVAGIIVKGIIMKMKQNDSNRYHAETHLLHNQYILPL